ncbi:MAG: hypothetical protein J0H01_26380 [Rhizobiales bacterium]|nr:hypothetical protein [Hyphomicrobiales bacterium]
MAANLRTSIKSVLRPIVLPIWRKIWARLETRLSPIESRVTTLDQAWNVHLPAFLNAVSTVGAFGHRLSAQAQELRQLSAQAQEFQKLSLRMQQELEAASGQIPRLWDRIEFARREMMFELAHGNRFDAAFGPKVESAPLIVNREKVETAIAAGNVRLNLGCGHLALPDHINVDMRNLPGVDIVASVDRLPFEVGTVSAIFSAHLVEHFPQEALRRRLLPYWMSLLKPGGMFQAITPDAAAMLKAAAGGDYSFEDFREVLFGGQDYEGDYHYNLLTPDSMTTLLTEAGLTEIAVPVAGRRNGKCYEFEIVGRRP